MKDLKKLKGAKLLSKLEQKVIKGGLTECGPGRPCPEGWYCDMHTLYHGVCLPEMPEM